MRCVVVGLGVQGYKRRKHAGDDFVVAVDPVNPEARYRRIEDVPLDDFDSALCCIPDAPKEEVVGYLLENGKHALVEKPLWLEERNSFKRLEEMANRKKLVCYTAYNHRFEPHFVRMKELITSGALGRIYSCRMFYGNGTARLVRESAWRDEGAGVLPDLGSHLLDTCRFWFGPLENSFRVIASNRFENRAPDHVIIGSEETEPRIELEMTLCMWRNHFTCDILAEKGTAHIESLCKWGPATLTHRTRVLPSGRPPEKCVRLVEEDPTWEVEYRHFKGLVESRAATDLSNDLWLQSTLEDLAKQL